MKKQYIILHWTAGNYTPNQIDLLHYQTLIDGAGRPIKGNNKPSATGGMNSITYNFSCCGRKDEETPIKPIQIEAMCHYAAIKCKELGLTPDKCYTHYEIGKMVQNGEIKKLLPYNKLLEQNIGKIDFKGLGDTLRNKIKWYYSKIK